MNAFRLALSLVRIPKLFISLILFPLLFSIIIVYIQMLITGSIIKAANSAPKTQDIEQAIRNKRDRDFVHRLIFGDTDPAPLKVCRWIETADGEAPPNVACSPDRLDFALRTALPASYDTSEYEKLLDGTVERLHVCRTCTPDVVIDVDGEEVKSNAKSVWGLGLLGLARFNNQQIRSAAEAFKDIRRHYELMGKVHLQSAGFRESIQITGSFSHLAVVANIAILIIITLWLALKAHRKVLDYFARSGALLPMVAATGKGSFYSAIWIVTLMRVAGFLVAAIPLTYFGLKELLKNEQRSAPITGDLTGFSLWLVVLLTSLGLATIIASIAELKHRHMILSFSYRYIPLLISSLGGILWAFTFLFDGSLWALLRHLITAAPLMGTTAVLVSPVFKPPFQVLLAHMLFTLFLVVLTVRSNARWFAAHLEDL